MSYILEALRRAEAEREREAGKLPTLNTPGRALPAADDDESAPRRGAGPTWLWPAAGVAVLVIAGGWWAWRDAKAPAPAAAQVPAPAASQAPAIASVTAVVPAASAPPPVQAPTAAPVAAPAAAPTLAQAAPTPVPSPAPPAPPAPVATVPPTPARPAAPPKVQRFADLTERRRREIPSLAFGGSIYSPDRDARMVIVNGQVRREGETVAPGLVLEQIGVRSAVFGFKGIRFEMPL